MNLQKMTKKQLEAHGRTMGIELDRRKSKKDMIDELNKVTKKTKKKAPAPVAKKKAPVAKKKAPVAKKKAVVLPKVSFWSKVKKYLNL